MHLVSPFVPSQWWEGENTGRALRTSYLGEENEPLPVDIVMGIPLFPTSPSFFLLSSLAQT